MPHPGGKSCPHQSRGRGWGHSVFGKGRATEELRAACIRGSPRGNEGILCVGLVYKQLSLGWFPAVCSPPEVSACGLASWQGGLSVSTVRSPVWACGRAGEKFQEKKKISLSETGHFGLKLSFISPAPERNSVSFSTRTGKGVLRFFCVFFFLKKIISSLRNMLNEAPALPDNLGERERLQFCLLSLRFLHWHRGIPVNAAGRMVLVQQ